MYAGDPRSEKLGGSMKSFCAAAWLALDLPAPLFESGDIEVEARGPSTCSGNSILNGQVKVPRNFGLPSFFEPLLLLVLEEVIGGGVVESVLD
jgi:hypothetical protein